MHINPLGIALLYFTVYFELKSSAALLIIVLCVCRSGCICILAWSYFLTWTAHLVWHHRPHAAQYTLQLLHATHCTQSSLQTAHCFMHTHISFGVMPSTASLPVDAADFKMHWWKRWQFGLWQCAISTSLGRFCIPSKINCFKSSLCKLYTCRYCIHNTQI